MDKLKIFTDKSTPVSRTMFSKGWNGAKILANTKI